MNLLPIRAEVYIDYDDISLVVERPDANTIQSQLDENLYKKTSEIIERAKADGVYFEVAGRDGEVRAVLVMKSGIVVGTDYTPETIMKRYKPDSRKSSSARTSARRK